MSELFWFYDLVYSLILASTAFANTFGVAALHEFVRFWFQLQCYHIGIISQMLEELFLIYISISLVRISVTAIVEVYTKMPHACQIIMSLKAYIFNIIGTKTHIYTDILYIYICLFL